MIETGIWVIFHIFFAVILVMSGVIFGLGFAIRSGDKAHVEIMKEQIKMLKESEVKNNDLQREISYGASELYRR